VSIYPQDPPAPEAVLVTSPALLAADGTPVRWLLAAGYVYDIRDDQDQPPWQKGRWAEPRDTAGPPSRSAR